MLTLTLTLTLTESSTGGSLGREKAMRRGAEGGMSLGAEAEKATLLRRASRAPAESAGRLRVWGQPGELEVKPRGGAGGESRVNRSPWPQLAVMDTCAMIGLGSAEPSTLTPGQITVGEEFSGMVRKGEVGLNHRELFWGCRSMGKQSVTAAAPG
jgi:hypothetical protein